MPHNALKAKLPSDKNNFFQCLRLQKVSRFSERILNYHLAININGWYQLRSSASCEVKTSFVRPAVLLSEVFVVFFQEWVLEAGYGDSLVHVLQLCIHCSTIHNTVITDSDKTFEPAAVRHCYGDCCLQSYFSGIPPRRCVSRIYFMQYWWL